VVAERRILDVDRFSSGAEFRDFFKATYGPTIAVYQRLVAAGDTAGIAISTGLWQSSATSTCAQMRR
jgi:hypothetical protein